MSKYQKSMPMISEDRGGYPIGLGVGVGAAGLVAVGVRVFVGVGRSGVFVRVGV